MSSDASGFDERRVIGELVQLQAAIRASREKRERAQAAFDAHLSTFRAPTEAVRPDAGVTMTPGALPVPVPRQPEGLVTIAAVETAATRPPGAQPRDRRGHRVRRPRGPRLAAAARAG